MNDFLLGIESRSSDLMWVEDECSTVRRVFLDKVVTL